jgi:hypothetical protein
MTFIAFGQDTTKTKKPKYKKFLSSIHLGGGIQRSFYNEIGYLRFINRANYQTKKIAIYPAFEWTPKILPVKEENIFGYKIGIDFYCNGYIYVIETKYQTDGKLNDIVITPKFGTEFPNLSINAYVGFNISTNYYPFSDIGRFQFSILYVINKKTFHPEMKHMRGQ